MDANGLRVLQADVEAQRDAIDRVFTMLEERSEKLSSQNPETLESIAYQLHNLYGAVEELLKLVAAYFENNIVDTSRWHSFLLQRMTQQIEDVRPAVISTESYELLNALRAFRHFFRHAYGVPIDVAQLQSNLDRARGLRPLLDRDLDRFLEILRTSSLHEDRQ